ncbi:MAG: NAD-dependent epimerase/dehydratase family protein [Phycisphaera sp.]|nr:NAD-dependent epimerase/dehydratase family protein [Phycisphaera sp.]
MNIFVTGHLGYIGVHLVELLKKAGHSVTGSDLGLFEGCEWEPLPKPDRDLRKDVRDLEESDLRGHDAVCHLAAISNDPMGELDPTLTQRVNRDASVRLAELAKAAKVKRFLFSSSCSVYGGGGDKALDETAPLDPLTEYARSKIETEQQVAKLADDRFTCAYLRNATAYGHSPMLRIDLVVNNLLACAVSTNEVRIMSDGSPWRPLIHCRDIARAFVAFLNAPTQAIQNQAINVGGNTENFRVRDVADQVQKLVPSAKIRYTGEVGHDPRNYRVSFDKLNRLIPDFKLHYTLASGMRELHAKLLDHRFSIDDFTGDQFTRLRTLKNRTHLLGLTPTTK